MAMACRRNVDMGLCAPSHSNFDGIYDSPCHKPLTFILKYLSFLNILKLQGENSWKVNVLLIFFFLVSNNTLVYKYPILINIIYYTRLTKGKRVQNIPIHTKQCL